MAEDSDAVQAAVIRQISAAADFSLQNAAPDQLIQTAPYSNRCNAEKFSQQAFTPMKLNLWGMAES